MKAYIKLLTILLVLNQTTQAQPLQSLTLMLDWYLNPNHAPLLVAQSQGYFKQQGLAVHFITPSDPMDPVKLVATQQVDLGISYPATLIMGLSKGLALQRVGALINHPLTCLLTKSNGPIQSIADLKHHRIAYTGDAADRAALQTVLAQAKLSLNEVALINVHFNLLQALLTDQVDAAIGISCNYQPLLMQHYGFSPHSFNLSHYGVPAHEEYIIISHSKRIHDAQLRKFMIALRQATTYLKHHPEQAWQAAITAFPEFNTAVNHTAWHYSLAYFSDNTTPFNRAEYQKYAQFLQQHQLIATIPRVTNLATG